MTVTKISLEELQRYRKIREKRVGKPTTPSTITVDVKQMKNLQGMIPVQLWTDIRVRASLDNVSNSRLMELALETYLSMESEDFQMIRERYEKVIKEEEEKEGGK